LEEPRGSGCSSQQRGALVILVIRHLHTQAIYKPSAGTGGVRQNGTTGAAFQRGQGSRGAASPLGASTPLVRNLLLVLSM